MRRFFFLLFAVIPGVLSAQTTGTEKPTLQALLAEVRELRLAIERSTLLGTRTQLAVSQLQLQEANAARAAQRLSEVKGQSAQDRITHLTENIKNAEAARTLAQQPGADLKSEIKSMKAELEFLTGQEQQRMARENEAAGQLQAAQNLVNESRSRIAEMERALDAALQQMLKAH